MFKIQSDNDLIANIGGILENIPDPEIPVLTITDLGIIRDIKKDNDTILIIITPTYSGCPATDVISMSIRMTLLEKGYPNIKIISQLSPAWTTDWITEKGRKKLKDYGIAPPVGKSINEDDLKDINIACPQCGSTNTMLISQFGSTPCKALYKCNDCKEPFDYFKCH